jgi:hypothetical protein
MKIKSTHIKRNHKNNKKNFTRRKRSGKMIKNKRKTQPRIFLNSHDGNVDKCIFLKTVNLLNINARIAIMLDIRKATVEQEVFQKYWKNKSNQHSSKVNNNAREKIYSNQN